MKENLRRYSVCTLRRCGTSTDRMYYLMIEFGHSDQKDPKLIFGIGEWYLRWFVDYARGRAVRIILNAPRESNAEEFVRLKSIGLGTVPADLDAGISHL